MENDLYKALNAEQQKFWSSFSPTGNVKIDLQMGKNNQTGRVTKLKIELLDVDASYEKFPYPLKNLTGELDFGRDKIFVRNALSRYGDIEIKINGEIIKNQMENKPYNFVIDVDNIPMDPVLEAALQNGQKQIYQNFQPAGFTKGTIEVHRTQSGDMEYYADLNCWDTAIKVDFLEKSVTDISANILLSPNLAEVKKLSGNYGDMPVSLTGRFIPEMEKRLCYDVSLDLKNVRLNDKELQSLLPESIKKTVKSFDPDGMADMVLDLKKLNPEKPVDYSVMMNCLGNSIYLKDFNCLVTDFTGLMKIDANNVKLKNITAFLDNRTKEESDREKVLLNGNIQLDNGALKQAELSVSAGNISVNENLIKFLPPQNMDLFKALSPTGYIGIDFNNFRLITHSDANNTIDFNGSINLGECDFVLSGKPAKLDSIIKVQGNYAFGKGFSDCKMLIDNGNLGFLGKTFTDLSTEVNYDPNQKKWSSKYFLADLYDGKTTGQLEFIQHESSSAEYILQAAFEHVDLEKFLSEANDTQAKATTSGKMSGSMSLSSNVPQNNSRIGSCRLSIKNMKVGKMSPIAQLLQVLNLNEPSEYAFDAMFIDSYIRRDGLFVEKLDMSGKSVAFHGSGLISLLNGDMNLSLTARGNRLASDDPSIIQSLTEGLGRAVIRMEVTGNYRDIKVETKTLPVIEGTLQIFGEPRVQN